MSETNPAKPAEARTAFQIIKKLGRTAERVNPVEFLKTFSQAEHHLDRDFRRRLLWRVTHFLMFALSGCLALIYLHSAGQIALPPEIITAIAYAIGTEITGLLAVIVANLFRRM